MPNVLLKNDASKGFNGGSFSRYEYNKFNVTVSASNFSSKDGKPLLTKKRKKKREIQFQIKIDNYFDNLLTLLVFHRPHWHDENAQTMVNLREVLLLSIRSNV